MLNLKKTAVAVLALGSSTVFAGTMGPVCTPGSVTVPCERTAWDFGVQALYLQTVSDRYAGYARVPDVNFASNNEALFIDRYNEIEPDWGWGFKVEASYHFNTGNDINFNWYHYEKESRENHLIYSPFVTTADFTADPNVLHTFRVEPRWDAANAEFGQHVDFGEQKNIRFHGGVQYARIRHDYHAFIPSTGIGHSGRTTYNGFGPRIGADMSYDFLNGVSIYGKSATAILIGDSRFADNTGVLGVVPTCSSRGSKTAMVPEVEAKLGATYTFSMAQGDISVDAGYMWVHYFDAQHVGYMNSNFSVHGPFAGVKWVGPGII